MYIEDYINYKCFRPCIQFIPFWLLLYLITPLSFTKRTTSNDTSRDLNIYIYIYTHISCNTYIINALTKGCKLCHSDYHLSLYNVTKFVKLRFNTSSLPRQNYKIYIYIHTPRKYSNWRVYSLFKLLLL